MRELRTAGPEESQGDTAARSERVLEDGGQLEALELLERRVLWLAVRIVDYANRERPGSDGGIKVGGHQASSASLVTAMTALWFSYLRAGDRVAVKPHASPVLHAIEYLLGRLDRRYLTSLREFGGLQAYPSRTKDPFPVDFSTGSVGLGAVAPLFAAVVRRYIDAHFGARPPNRFVALVGDAELDEGNIWEAVADPVTAGLGNVLWIVDLNRQSLDRVVPGIRARRLQMMFDDNGWHVIEVKYGRRLQEVFARSDGDALRQRIDDMSNEEYQSLFGYTGAALRARLFAGGDPRLRAAVADIPDAELAGVIQNLGGHDIAELLRAFGRADEVDDRPSVVFAYTVKGWGLPIAGNPLNHAALMTQKQIAALRRSVGLDDSNEWERIPEDTPAGRLCAEAAARLFAAPVARASPDRRVPVPTELRLRSAKPISTQEAFGRLLTVLARQPGVAERMVTTAPDVATSTNLAGWINKAGVFAPERQPAWASERHMLRWRRAPAASISSSASAR